MVPASKFTLRHIYLNRLKVSPFRNVMVLRNESKYMVDIMHRLTAILSFRQIAISVGEVYDRADWSRTRTATTSSRMPQ